MNEFDVNEFTTSKDDSDFLGSGSFANVRRCRHKELGTVVVKCFALTGSELAINQQSENISKEAQVLCRLDHKNIIKVFGVTQWSTRYGIVMEEAAGYNLEDLFIREQNRDIPWPVRLRFMSEIAEGLEYLHCHDPKRSYIHGDLKLQNILLSDRLEIKIADFGAVNLLQATDASTSSITFDPSKQLTQLYSAPELLKNPEIQRTRAMDIYSYAMIGYEIITRKKVFFSSKARFDLILSLIKYEDQKPDTSLIDHIKNDLTNQSDSEICFVIEAIVVGCWKTSPNERLDIQNVISRLKHLTDYISDPQHDDSHLRKNTTSASSTQISLKKFDSGFETSASSSESFSNDPKPKSNKNVFPKFFTSDTSHSADEMESEMVEEHSSSVGNNKKPPKALSSAPISSTGSIAYIDNEINKKTKEFKMFLAGRISRDETKDLYRKYCKESNPEIFLDDCERYYVYTKDIFLAVWSKLERRGTESFNPKIVLGFFVSIGNKLIADQIRKKFSDLN